MKNENDRDSEVIEHPVDGIIDLHTFRPQDAKNVVKDYIGACLEEEITQIRIIHGKGKGVLRGIVHTVLDRHPAVIAYRTDAGQGSWGATVATLDLTGGSGAAKH